MPTTYTNGRAIYTLEASGPEVSGAFSIAVDRPSGFTFTEADLDAAVEAFTDSLNASGHERLDRVTKVVEASGVSDWLYQPPTP